MEHIDYNNSVEESIRRTQQVLNRRLGVATQGNDDLLSPGTETSSVSGRTGSSAKLIETIQQAHSMYPVSPLSATYGSSVMQGRVSEAAMELDVNFPVLQPVSPPSAKGPAGQLHVFPDDMLEEEQDEDDEGIANAEGLLGKDALRFQYLAGKTPSSNNGTGIASSKSKKGKKKAKKANSNQDTLGNFIQLPRISHSKSQPSK
jgi:hypothetical protein